MEEELQESNELPDFTEIKGIVRRRRWQFLVPFFCGWALVWGASWLIPSTYRSGTLILVEQPSVPEKYVVSNIDTDIQHQLDSITQQILSRTRLLRIIDSLGLYAQERKHKSPDDLVEKMRKDIEIELSHGDDQEALRLQYLLRESRSEDGAGGHGRARESLHHGKSGAAAEAFGEHDQLPRRSARSGARKTRATRSEIARVQRSAPGRVAHPDPEQSADPDRPAESGASERRFAEPGQAAKYLSGIADQSISRHGQRFEAGRTGGPVGLAAIDKELDQLKAQLADLTSHYTDKHPDVRKTKEQIARTEKMRERIVADMNSRANNSSPAPAAAHAARSEKRTDAGAGKSTEGQSPRNREPAKRKSKTSKARSTNIRHG